MRAHATRHRADVQARMTAPEPLLLLNPNY